VFGPKLSAVDGILLYMTGFDIASILDFQPPRYICPVCRGLAGALKTEVSHEPPHRVAYSCPECSTRLELDVWFGKTETVPSQMRREGYVIDQRNLFPHATALARLVRDSRGTGDAEPWPTMRLFFEVLAHAQHFVHFTSWGISHVMIGALKSVSMRVPVHGFVSHVENHARVELTEYPSEAPQFHARVIPTSQGIYDAPHQKIIIIDGLLAFKGSTNLTGAGMRRADRGLDLSEVVTDFQQVTDLNNRYFAPVWRQLNLVEDNVYVFDGPPF
jgi:hypothetical protein